MGRIAVLLLAGCLAAVSADTATAQGVGGVSGVVVSQDGLRLPGATVLLTSQSGDGSMTVRANEHGVYRVSNLTPGVYVLAAEMGGFETASREGVKVDAGATVVVDVTLQVAGIQEVVSVAAALPRDSLETTEVRVSSGRDIGEALADLTGIHKVRRAGIASDVVVRGYQGRNLTVLLNGARLYGACPNVMDPSAFHADFAEVERIEIGKGPFDIRNQGSLGGVLNVVTKRPASGLHLDASLSTGSSGFANPSAVLSWGRDRWAVLGGASYRRSDPYRDGTGRRFTEPANYLAGFADSTAYAVGTGWVKGHVWSGTARSLQVSYTRQDADHVLYPYLQMDALTDVADRASVGYQEAVSRGPVGSIHAQAYYTSVRHWMTDQYRAFVPQDAAQLQHGHRRTHPHHRWQGGIDRPRPRRGPRGLSA